jgi:hypothetical protein
MAYSKAKLKSYGNVVSLDFSLLGLGNVLEIFDYMDATVNCQSCSSNLLNDVGNSSN